MTQQNFKFENVEVSFSTMLNKPEKCAYGRNFKVKVPIDSPVLKELKDAYKALNDKAKIAFGEKVGKKLRNAKSVDDMFAESIYSEGFVELPFNIYFRKENEVKNEDGTTSKKSVEVLNPIYSTSEFSYMVNNNGEKVYKTESGKVFYPLSKNIVDITVSLVAKYNSKENKPSIQLKADDVKIVKSEFGLKSSGPKTGFLTLDDENLVIEQKVEKTVAPKSDEMFSEQDLVALDI